jgi:hypothetical protein
VLESHLLLLQVSPGRQWRWSHQADRIWEDFSVVLVDVSSKRYESDQSRAHRLPILVAVR